MNIHLEPFQEIDLTFLENWKQQINSDLYMSRTTPKEFNGKTTHNDDLWRWFKIIVTIHHFQSLTGQSQPSDDACGKLSEALDASIVGRLADFRIRY